MEVDKTRLAIAKVLLNDLNKARAELIQYEEMLNKYLVDLMKLSSIENTDDYILNMQLGKFVLKPGLQKQSQELK